jgi:hypothetical protein
MIALTLNGFVSNRATPPYGVAGTLRERRTMPRALAAKLAPKAVTPLSADASAGPAK